MFAPADEEIQLRMEKVHAQAAQRLGVSCVGPAAWGWQGRTIGRRADDQWLRVAAAPEGRSPRAPGKGIASAEAQLPDSVPRPRLIAISAWSVDGYRYEAELTTYVSAPVVSGHRPDLDRDPELSGIWWSSLRSALNTIAEVQQAPRLTVRDEWITRAFPEFLSISAPAEVHRVTGHADLHWANLTRDPFTLLDWERWGAVPVGFDAGLLHAYSLLTPSVATRIRTEFGDVLNTPAGRVGELCAVAEMLQAVTRGWYTDLAPHLKAHAAALTREPPA
ncbi:hypothetical protein ACWIG5_36360 [Streptomyces lydicus]